MSKSFRPMMQISATELAGNGLRFKTEDEAAAQAAELMMRWTVPTGYEVQPSDDAPNYRWDTTLQKIVALPTEVTS
jgi:hypothetical protein